MGGKGGRSNWSEAPIRCCAEHGFDYCAGSYLEMIVSGAILV
jgi:hypothetical protein